MEVIDLCSISQTEIDENGKGKDSAKQESQDKTKTNVIHIMEDQNRPIKSKPMTKNDEEHETYRRGVGTLLYLTKHSRPDICNPVREL